MDWLTDAQVWTGLLTLTVLEIVLGIDNVIFISILAGKLPAAQQQKARTVGLALAMLTRIALLFSLTWIMKLTEPLFSVPVMRQEVSGRDLILLLGGLFLIGKATHEIHQKLEGAEGHASARVAAFSSSAHSSPTPVCDPSPWIVTFDTTTTFAATAVSLLSPGARRSKFCATWTS